MKVSAILSLRLQGASLDAIGAAQEPPHTKQAIWKLLKRAMRDMLVEPFEALRTMELARLDELMVPIYERALAGDISAIDTVLSIQVRRAKLMGLDAQPVRSGAAGTSDGEGAMVRVEIVNDPERAAREQVARIALGRGPHLG